MASALGLSSLQVSVCPGSSEWETPVGSFSAAEESFHRNACWSDFPCRRNHASRCPHPANTSSRSLRKCTDVEPSVDVVPAPPFLRRTSDNWDAAAAAAVVVVLRADFRWVFSAARVLHLAHGTQRRSLPRRSYRRGSHSYCSENLPTEYFPARVPAMAEDFVLHQRSSRRLA